MALVKVKPTSAGRRGMIKVVSPQLHKGGPFEGLLEKKKRGSGRNNNGHITVRHRGGGHKQHYRIVDFRRNKDGIVAKVERLEYDPNRTAHLALLCYADGERRYIIAPRGLEVGSTLLSGKAWHLSVPVILCLSAIFQSVPLFTASKCNPAKVRKWRAQPVRQRFCWRAKGFTPRFACVPVRFVAFISIVAQPLVKWVMKNTACVKSVKPVPCVGAVSAQPYVVWQ